MSTERPYCLSIAGHDPCGGAGILSDIKVFENLQCYGLGVITAITYQNDSNFEGLKWLSEEETMHQLEILKKYPVKAVKIGLIQNFAHLAKIIKQIKLNFHDAFIVWDPILKATAGYSFHEQSTISEELIRHIDLITPNNDEFKQLRLGKMVSSANSILLKGGHNKERPGVDLLFSEGSQQVLTGLPFGEGADKHGTGCVLSSAIAAYIAKGNRISEACRLGKKYVEKFMLSNNTKLGYHNE